MKWQATNQKKILVHDIWQRTSILDDVKNSQNSIRNPIRIWANEMERYTKMICRCQIRTWKDIQHHLPLGKCKLKPTWDVTTYLWKGLK